MCIPKRLFGYSTAVLGKLLLLITIIFAVNDLVLYLLIQKVLPHPLWISLAVSCTPLFFLGAYLLWMRIIKNTPFIDALANCKYFKYFPFVFVYDCKSKSAIKQQHNTGDIQNGDIILRNHKHHLDSIIFSENSYFTHVGICDTDTQSSVKKVWHCTAENGVHLEDLDTFCKCDVFAVFRFSFDESAEENRIRNYINSQLNEQDQGDRQGELEIFEQRLKAAKTDIELIPAKNNRSFEQHCKELVLQRARALKGKPYDKDFDFYNFDKMSCVEYVWYCHKFLYPLHRIKVDDFEFLNCVRFPVINPDVFAKNDYFKFIHCSNNNACTQEKLLEVIGRRTNKFLCFVFSILLSNVVIMVLTFLIIKYCIKA